MSPRGQQAGSSPEGSAPGHWAMGRPVSPGLGGQPCSGALRGQGGHTLLWTVQRAKMRPGPSLPLGAALSGAGRPECTFRLSLCPRPVCADDATLTALSAIADHGPDPVPLGKGPSTSCWGWSTQSCQGARGPAVQTLPPGQIWRKSPCRSLTR